jgi:hypothetical protein
MGVKNIELPIFFSFRLGFFQGSNFEPKNKGIKKPVGKNWFWDWFLGFGYLKRSLFQ